MQTYIDQEWLIPQPFEPQWTDLDDGVILNDNPSAWLQSQNDALPLQAPFGDGGSAWENPCSAHTIPISANSGGVLAVLTQNLKRNLLVIQNNSTATSPDAAPVFYVGFGQIAQVGQGLGLPPGVGIVLDIICPRDAVYLTIGPAVNTGGSVITQGVVIEGGLSDPTGS
jgi:hypothetical protein